MKHKDFLDNKPITKKLPRRIDLFLQEVAIFTEYDLTYSEIEEFSEVFNSKDLSYLRRCENEIDICDSKAEIEEIRIHVSDYVKRKIK